MSGPLINTFKRDDIEIYVSFVILMVKAPVLTGPEVVVHKSLGGFGWLISVLLLLLQGNSGGGAGDLQKTLRCLSQHW